MSIISALFYRTSNQIISQTIVDSMTSPYSGYQLYCSPSGSDTTGDGSIIKPFRQLQHAAAVISDSSLLARAKGRRLQGVIQINAAPGYYNPVTVPEISNAGLLNIRFVADRTNVAESWNLPSGSRPTNPSNINKTKSAVFEYNVGSYASSIDTGSHWLEFSYTYGSGEITYGLVVDGAKSSSPKIRVVSTGDLFTNYSGATAKLQPFSCHIVPDSENVTSGGVISLGSNNPEVISSAVTVDFIGFSVGGLTTDFQSTLETFGASFHACNFDNVTWTCSRVANTRFEIHLFSNSFAQLLGGENTIFSGIFDSAPAFAGAKCETFINGILRGKDGNGVMMYLGAVTAGRAPSASSYEIEYFDIEDSTNGSSHILINGSCVRFGNHGPVSIDGTNFFRAIHRSYIILVTISGASASVPCILENGSCCTGASLLSTKLINLTTGLSENLFTVNGATISFSQVPYSELITFSVVS